MRECRFYPWCSYIEDHGCTKDSCRRYQPMPDVGALLALADEMYGRLDEYDVGLHGGIYMANEMRKCARRIREACGEVVE